MTRDSEIIIIIIIIIIFVSDKHFFMYRVRHKSVNIPVRHKSVNTPVRHKSVNTPSSHERHVVRTWLAVYSGWG